MDILTPTSNPRQRPESPWWLEIKTRQPACVYYFGPFESKEVADNARWGHIYDLLAEKSVGLTFKISQHQPVKLTITSD